MLVDSNGMQTHINVVSKTCVMEAEALHRDKSCDEAKMKTSRHSMKRLSAQQALPMVTLELLKRELRRR